MEFSRADESAILDGVPDRLLIGGEWRDGGDGRTFAVEDPSSGTQIVDVADASAADGLAALSAAAEAFGEWSQAAPRQRSKVLRRAYDLVLEREDQLTALLSLETGKPLAQSRGELAGTADYLLWYSEEAVRCEGQAAITPDGGAMMLALREPVGPCLLLPTWNFPSVTPSRKLAAALAAGCTTVLRPHELAPLSALAIVQALVDAGAPAGVVNVVPTMRSPELVSAVMQDSRLRKVSMTGSTRVGKLITAQAAQNMQRVSMELGGNAPFIVFPDADLDEAVAGAIFAKERSTGATCTAANRLFVHETIAAEFSQRLAAGFESMKLGPGLEPDSVLGPLISASEVEKIEAMIADALDRGARIHSGGKRLDREGHFFPPTVLTGVHPESRVVQEEIFGPIAPVIPFADEDEVIERANATPFGLMVYLYTRDLNRALRVSGRLETGMVGLNHLTLGRASAPFGGTKWSGIGREGGHEGLEEYLNIKYIAVGRS